MKTPIRARTIFIVFLLCAVAGTVLVNRLAHRNRCYVWRDATVQCEGMP